MQLSLLHRFGLNVVVLPFLLGGMVVAFYAGVWIASLFGEPRDSWTCVITSFLLMPLGIGAGGLLAYGLLVLVLRCISPAHPWLAETGMQPPPGVITRLMAPAFGTVRRFIFWLTARR